jgi:hypothetical protein
MLNSAGSSIIGAEASSSTIKLSSSSNCTSLSDKLSLSSGLDSGNGRRPSSLSPLSSSLSPCSSDDSD